MIIATAPDDCGKDRRYACDGEPMSVFDDAMLAVTVVVTGMWLLFLGHCVSIVAGWVF